MKLPRRKFLSASAMAAFYAYLIDPFDAEAKRPTINTASSAVRLDGAKATLRINGVEIEPTAWNLTDRIDFKNPRRFTAAITLTGTEFDLVQWNHNAVNDVALSIDFSGGPCAEYSKQMRIERIYECPSLGYDEEYFGKDRQFTDVYVTLVHEAEPLQYGHLLLSSSAI